MEHDDQPGTSSGITDVHQHRVGRVARFARHVHPRDEPLEAATRDGEVDRWYRARRYSSYDTGTRTTTYLEVGATRCSGPRNGRRRSGPANGRGYAVRYPCGQTSRHGILRRFIPGFPCGSGRLIAHPCLELVHAASV